MKIKRVIIHLDNAEYIYPHYVDKNVITVELYQSVMRKNIYSISASNPSTVLLTNVNRAILEFFQNYGCPILRYPGHDLYVIISDDILFSLKLRGDNKNKNQLVLSLPNV
jgi:hypothetical protein